MQRTIKSFFQPKAGLEQKEVKEDVRKRSLEVAERVPEDLNKTGTSDLHEECSPIKVVSKKALRVIESDSDEGAMVELNRKNEGSQSDAVKQTPQKKKEGAHFGSTNSSEEMSPCTRLSTNSPSCSDSPGISPSGIPKRKTARKQIPKRKREDIAEADVLVEHSDIHLADKRPKKDNKSPASTTANSEDDCQQESKPTPFLSSSEAMPSTEMHTKECHTEAANTMYAKEINEKDDNIFKPLVSGNPKPISSFFAPRKPKVEDEIALETAITNSIPSHSTKSEKSVDGSTFGPETQKEQTEYNPSKSYYHIVTDACWSHGQKVPYLAVARTFERIEDESARLKNIETLSNFLRSVITLSPEDFLPCIYLSLNRLGPAYEGIELGIGETILLKAVAQATGRQLEKIKKEAQEKGDLGLVAESSRSNQRIMFKPPNLTASGVFNRLKEIAKMTGSSSMNKKIDIIKGLFVACRHSEARYIARSLGGKLRIGLAEQSVLSAIAHAVCLTPPSQAFPPAVLDAGKGMSTDARKAWLEENVVILKQTFCELPNYDVILPVLLEHGIENLPKYCRLTPGVPLKPMLAHPTKGIGEVLKRFDEAAFTCEYKYDGERAQIHILENGKVCIYSRNQENNTSKYPDIISRIPKVKKEGVKSCILDTEAVAWDPEKKQIQPFQVLTTRKRKDVDATEIKVQVCVYAFDLLYLNGESLVKEPFVKRRQLLRDSFLETEGEFMFAVCMDTSNTDEISEFLDQSIKDSCEGLMVKTLEQDATYEIAKRSHNWLKLKKDYLEGVGDTLDLVVIGAYLGKGKRTGLYGGFLLASYDEESEEYQTICKIGTGFTDEDLEKHYNFLKDHVIESPRSYYRWDGCMQPDHWFHPVQVWEVKCADLSVSPVHKAALGLVESEKGISLRFPRFVRVRDDKKPEEATNSLQVADLYRKQQQIQNTLSAEKGEEDFY
ncbi:DNA ligase 1 isoform X2 [Spea bombifrons]|uniref:DNA ligase 1 isoform X2 n=1 Tax=Spea bombifrons TaxID=233779 RepID=UPI00234BB1B7|nr:DNA ligase 1 isoform X2 [Spea bombifrons]